MRRNCFQTFHITHIFLEGNKAADYLANKARATDYLADIFGQTPGRFAMNEDDVDTK